MPILRFLPGAAAIPRPGFKGPKAVVKQLAGYAGQDAYAVCTTSSSTSNHSPRHKCSRDGGVDSVPLPMRGHNTPTKYVLGNPSLLWHQHEGDMKTLSADIPKPPPPLPPRPPKGDVRLDINGNLSQASCPDGLVLALADGVHAWQKHNIDAGRFARELVTAVTAAATELGGATTGPLALLQHAHAQVVRKRGVMGSSTACVACLDGVRRTLRVANLGDSRLIVVRDGQIILRSPVVEHHFGYPFQLGHHKSADNPADASVVWMDDLRAGDDIIVGSDGLFDNLDSDRIAELVAAAPPTKPGAQIARELAIDALSLSMSKTEPTPYSIAASVWLDLIYNGGKKDDICVVCVRVLAC